MRNSFDALCPKSLVKFRVESHVICAHCFACKFDDGFDSPGNTSFKRSTMNALMEVDGIFPGYDILEGRARFGSLNCGIIAERMAGEDQRKPTFFFVVMTCR